MDLPLVSVGIPTYNRPEGLRSILNDICNQCYRNIEIIVSDNASPDPLVFSILEEFSKIDNRIVFYVQEENKGPFFNFEFVLKVANGDYFIWAADDDGFEIEYIEKCVIQFQNAPRAIMATTACRIIDLNRSTYKSHNNFQALESTAFERVKNTLSQVIDSNVIFYSLYKRSVLTKMNWSKYFGSDLLFTATMAQYGHIVSNNNYIGYTYSISNQGLSANFERYKDAAGFKSKLSRHFFFTISLFLSIIDILKFQQVSLVDRLRLSVYYFKIFKNNYRWRYIKNEFSSFFSVVKNKIRV